MKKIPKGKQVAFLLSNPMLLQGLQGLLPLLNNPGMMGGMMGGFNRPGMWGAPRPNLMGQQQPQANPNNPGSNPETPTPPQADVESTIQDIFGGEDINAAMQNAGKMFQAFNDSGLADQLGPMFKQVQPFINSLLKVSANGKPKGVKSRGTVRMKGVKASYSKLKRRRSRVKGA